MAPPSVANDVSLKPTVAFLFGLTLTLGACGEDKSAGEPGPVASNTSDPTTTFVPGNTTGPSGTSVTGPTGANTSPGATGATGGPGTTGTTTTGGMPTGATGVTTTGPSSGPNTGPVSSGDDASDVDTDGSNDTGPASTSDGETSEPPTSTECTRELLDGLLDDYFAALDAGDPSTLPLADNVKFTENAEVVEIGSTAFWMNAGATKHSQRALDTTACSVAAQAVIPEGTTDLPVGIRIKVEAGEMTEIETIVVRQGDYTASFAVDSNTAAIISIAPEIGWHDEVPEAQRATREQLSGWVDKYFRAFPAGVCDVTQACKRLENGGGNFNCSDGASCTGQTPATGGTFEPRVIVVDEVRGIAAGFTIFEFGGSSGHLDMHMMKMSGGEVHAVHAILRDTQGESGWD